MMDAMETLKSIYKMNTNIKCFINKKINNKITIEIGGFSLVARG